MPFIVAVVVAAEVVTGGGVSKTVKKGVDAVIKTGGKVVDKVVDTGRAIIKNPLPVIETIALTAAGVPAPLASAAVTAANGGNVKDIATAAIGSYVGGEVGGKVGQKVNAAGYSKVASQVAASASGASVAGTLQGVLSGKDLGTALQMGLKSGATAGLTQGVISGYKEYTGYREPGTAPIEERSTGGTLASRGDTGLITEREFPTGMSSSLSAGVPSYYVNIPSETQLASEALAPTIYKSLFGSPTARQTLASAAPTTTKTQQQQKTPQLTPTQTTATPGSQALAQALRVGDVGAPIFGGEKEGGRKSGWNVESLRYMGNTGEA